MKISNNVSFLLKTCMSGGIFIKVNENMHHFYKGIGVGGFTILGGPRFRILGGGGGGGEPRWGQIPSRHMTSFRCHVPTRFLINQCQIITSITLKSDIIENSRIELRGMVLPVPSNQTKDWGGGGGVQRVCWPLSNYWGGLAPPPWSWSPLFLRL